MHGMFERPSEAVKRIYLGWGIGIFALPVLVAIALVGLAMTHLDRSNAMSQTLQAEFARGKYWPDVAPKQPALPAGKVDAVRTN